jgi:Bacterial SH3 domain
MNCLNCGKPVENPIDIAGHEACPNCSVGIPNSVISGNSNQSVFRVEEPPGYMWFILDEKVSSARLFEKPSETSSVVCTLGQREALPIAAEQGEWYELFFAPGKTGFIKKQHGRKLELGSGEVSEPLGYYRVDTETRFGRDRLTAVNIRTMPDENAPVVTRLERWQCVAILEERPGWFKVQLDDGIRGFVPQQYGIRTLQKTSLPLPSSPAQNRAALGRFMLGAAGVVGAGAKVMGKQIGDDLRRG